MKMPWDDIGRQLVDRGRQIDETQKHVADSNTFSL